MTRPPWLTGSSVQTLIDRLNAWFKYLSESATANAGGRATLIAGHVLGVSGGQNLDDAIGNATSPTHGYVMPKSGSVVSCSIVATIVGADTGGTSLACEVRVNDVPTLTATKMIAADSTYSWYATAPTGTYRFEAGDLIQFHLTEGDGVCPREGVLVLAEVQYDT